MTTSPKSTPGTGEELKPCAFCGKHLVHDKKLCRWHHPPIEHSPSRWHCPAETYAFHDSRKDCMEEWNRRPSPSDGVREALEKAAKQFRFYEREHREKAMAAEQYDPAEAASREAKYKTNQQFAEMCEAALSSGDGEGEE